MIGVDEKVAELAQDYNVYGIPNVLLLGLFDCEQRLFNNFGKAYLCTISVIGTLVM